MFTKTMFIAGVFGAAILFSGCASSPPTGSASGDAPASNRYAKALAYPDRLQPTGDDGAMRWKDPAVDFRKYDRILIERIRVDLDADSSSVDPNELKALVDYFHQTVVKAIDPPYRIVDRPGRGVLRVRVTLVDLVATKPAVSVAVLLTPYATLPDLISGTTGGGPAGSAPYLGQWAAQFRSRLDQISGR
jgi:hypothetical protein